MRATVYIGTSLDGFIARSDGDIGWLTPFGNDEAGRNYIEFENRVDAILIGRGTFDKVVTFPEWLYEKPVFVLSRSLKQVPEAFRGKVTVLSEQPREALNYLAGQGLSRIYVDGGKVIQSFLAEDLIDEMVIAKVPVLIGSGIPLFGHLDTDLPFRHERTEVFSNGLVQSYYLRDRK